MPAPAVYTYSAAALINAQTEFLTLIGVSTAGSIKLRDESDVLLAEIPLSVPCGTVDGAGQLTYPPTAGDATLMEHWLDAGGRWVASTAISVLERVR